MQIEEIKPKLSTQIYPVLKNDEKYRLSSVLVVIYGEKPCVIMTEKPKYMKFHAGEITFPGGKLDNDKDLLDTALRETREEIGLSVTRDQVIGQLEPVITLYSGFLILPFITILDQIPPLSTSSEVEKIFHIPLSPFLQTMINDPDPSHNATQKIFTFNSDKQVVWGASARILQQIHRSLEL